MAKIHFSDSLFVNVIMQGRLLLTLKLTGFSSAVELMKHLRKQLTQYAGQLLTLELRNSTQGWSRRDAVLFAA